MQKKEDEEERKEEEKEEEDRAARREDRESRTGHWAIVGRRVLDLCGQRHRLSPLFLFSFLKS